MHFISTLACSQHPATLFPENLHSPQTRNGHHSRLQFRGVWHPYNLLCTIVCKSLCGCTQVPMSKVICNNQLNEPCGGEGVQFGVRLVPTSCFTCASWLSIALEYLSGQLGFEDLGPTVQQLWAMENANNEVTFARLHRALINDAAQPSLQARQVFMPTPLS